MKKILYTLILTASFAFSAFSQTGNYYINNFSPYDYGASDQNWCSIQDKYGRIYIANNNGILLNDGKEWKTILLRNGSICFSLDKDKNDKIFVGCNGEFGYLTTSSKGLIEYVSLSKDLPEKDREFGYIWATCCINDEVFFGANEKLFWYKNGVIKSFAPESEGFHTFFKVHNHLFVREKQVGFKVFVDGVLKKIEDTENFANERVDFILPFKNKTYWVGTRNKGMYLMVYDSENPCKSVFSKIKTPVDRWMSENDLYCGTKINENTYALGSLKGGVLLVDKNFKTFKSITDKEGLLDNAVNNIFVDSNENIWLSLNVGMSFVELNTPITRWAKSGGIKGVIEAAVKFEKQLYIVTDKGLKVLNGSTNKFLTTDIGDPSFAFLIKNKKLLVGTSEGLYSLNKGKSSLLFRSTVYCLFQDFVDTSIFYIGTDKGLTVAGFRNNVFKELKNYNDWGEVHTIAGMGKNGMIGFGTSNNGIYLSDSKNNFQHLTNKDGLPALNNNKVFSFNQQLLIATNQGFYKIENNSGKIKTVKLNYLNSESSDVFPVACAKQIDNDIWYYYKRNTESGFKSYILGSIRVTEKGVNENHLMLHRIKGADTKDFYKDSNRVYISTNDGLYCYDNSVTPKQTPFYTFISTLTFKNDTVPTLQNLTSNIKYPTIEIPFDKNEFKIIPAASDYYDANELTFSYYLEGKEDKYGSWNKSPVITYNNLREGNYVFHLKSKNIMGQEGKEISFVFAVLPPWYRTSWAYILYLLVGTTLIWLIVILNTRRLKEKNLRLEKIITDRTKTIAHQKEEIEHKNREITDSINYAKRIQEAILPSVKEIKKNWKDFFVFFQPKDIVSGDFYWYYKIDEHEFLIGAVDCTGHGVPGGFMSMIGSDKLNEAVNISKVPSEILHYVNNAIKAALKQGNLDATTTQDGMEIALLRINTQTRQVQYSGANRPLWIVNGDNELIEVKPTKASVASNTHHDFKYELHELQLSHADTLYISSDGYQDQFGGPKGKKFMTANFKKFLLSIKNEPMQKQEKLVQENIDKWMEGFEQIDDLLVIGIKSG